jgi:hypothetical protein
MELTKEYFDEQLKNLATKDDVKAIDQRVANLDNRVADLDKFVQKNLVTKQEFDKRFEELPTRKDFSQLQSSVDGIAKLFAEGADERTVNASRSARMEAWIIKAASKIGVDYKP